jgi:cation:H+ antiporter
MYIIGFIFCAIVIFLAGKKLSFYGDLLAEKTGLGKAWIGLILMSAVTSLPELMVGIGSVSFVHSADLAVGDVLGSCALNLGILSFMDVFSPKNKPVLGKASQSHILAGSLGIILMVIVGVGIFVPFSLKVLPTLGIVSILFALVYFLSLKIIYEFNKKQHIKETTHEEITLSLSKIITYYSFYALLIVVTALFIPGFAEQIAEKSGLGKSFVGTFLLAISTSLPELAISYACIKTGSIDMAIGNLFGSNLFNVFILFIDDIFYVQGELLKHTNQLNLFSVFSVILMSAIAIIGMLYKSKHKRFILAWDTLLILVIYVINLVFLYYTTKEN